MSTTPTPMMTPPWVAMIQAHADQAQAHLDARADQTDDYHATQNLDYAIRHGRRAGVENLARDTANSAHEDVTGTRHRTPTHYGTPREEQA